MQEKDVTSNRLLSLIRASKNAGGELESIMKDSLENSKTEKDFETSWYYNLKNFANRIIGFHNELAERNGYDTVNTI